MMLRSMFAENYRSLRSIRMDLAGVNLFIGENGVGKSNSIVPCSWFRLP